MSEEENEELRKAIWEEPKHERKVTTFRGILKIEDNEIVETIGEAVRWCVTLEKQSGTR